MNKKLLSAALAVIAGLSLIGMANFHFVTGSAVSGVKMEKKLSMSLSETFVNLDSVGNMPMIAARAQYPMYVARLEQRVQYLTVGCGGVKVGMWRSEALERCGTPARIEKVSNQQEIFHWQDGVVINVDGGKVSAISD